MIDRSRPLFFLSRRWFLGVTVLALAVLAAPHAVGLVCLLAGVLGFMFVGLEIGLVAGGLIVLTIAPFLLSVALLALAPKKGAALALPPVPGVVAAILLLVTVGVLLLTDWPQWCFAKHDRNLTLALELAHTFWNMCLVGFWTLHDAFLDHQVYYYAAGVWGAGLACTALTVALLLAAKVQRPFLLWFCNIRGRCPRCGDTKHQWSCSECGAWHDDLFPSRYGIWNARCANCEQGLPTTAGRKRRLQRACACGCALTHPDFARLPEFHVAVVGARASGKTTLLTAALDFLDKHVGPGSPYELIFASPAEENDFRTRVQGLMRAGVCQATAPATRPTALVVSVRKRSTGTGFLLYLYDASALDVAEALSGHDFHAFIDAVILVVDPFGEEGLRAAVQAQGAAAPPLPANHHDAHFILGQLIPHWSRLQHVSADRHFTFPVAVVLDKMESARLNQRVGGLVDLTGLYPTVAAAVHDVEAQSGAVRQLLEECGCTELLVVLRSYFSRHGFFAVNSLQRGAETDDGEPLLSRGAVGPVLWALQQASAWPSTIAPLRWGGCCARYLNRCRKGLEGPGAKWRFYGWASACLLFLVACPWLGYYAPALFADMDFRATPRAPDTRGVDERLRTSARREQDYHDLMKAGKVQTAAQVLTEGSLEKVPLQKAKDDFRARSPDLLAAGVKGKSWAEAHDILKAFANDRHVRELLSAQDLRKLDQIKHEVDAGEDRRLYAPLRDPATERPEGIQVYLTKAPLKTMRGAVLALDDFNKKKVGPLPLKFETVINWAPECWQSANVIRTSVDGAPLSDANARSVRGGQSNLGAKVIVRRLSDPVTFRIEIDTTGDFINDGQGKGSATFRLADLLGGGQTFVLDRPRFSDPKTSVLVRLDPSSLPSRPTLPDWGGGHSHFTLKAPTWWFYSAYTALGLLSLGTLVRRLRMPIQ